MAYLLESFTDDSWVNSFLKEFLGCFQETSSQDYNTSSSITSFDILGFGQFNQLEQNVLLLNGILSGYKLKTNFTILAAG